MCVVACAHTHTHTHTGISQSFKPEWDISSMFVICSVYSIQCFIVALYTCFTHLFVFFLSLPLSPLFHSLLCHSLSSPLPSLSSLLTPSFLIPSPLPFLPTIPPALPFNSFPPSLLFLSSYLSFSFLFIPLPLPPPPLPTVRTHLKAGG